MSRRALHWLVLGFTTLWFGVLVPVHNRGEITLAGGEDHCAAGKVAAAAPHCHGVAAARPDTTDRDPAHAPRPARTCAVCFFIAGLDAPPPVWFIETRLGYVGTHDTPPPQAVSAATPALSFHSRAPPLT